VSGGNRKRNIHLHIMVTQGELEQIRERMAAAGVQNAGAYMRKMALNGYVLNVDLTPVRDLVSLQRRCANNLNQIAVHANTHGVYPQEISALQNDYAALWQPLNALLLQLAAVVKM
jgi:predicted HAD superfamily hydrolase